MQPNLHHSDRSAGPVKITAFTHQGLLASQLQVACLHVQDSYTLLVAAQASLDDAIIGDPITSPVALAAILDFFAGQLAVPPDADAAVTVLQDVQVRIQGVASLVCFARRPGTAA